MTFQVIALDAALFRELYGLDEATLASRGVSRHVVDATPGFPCRVSLADAEPGETVLLLSYLHQPAHTPYRSRHAIFIREGADTARPAANEVPVVLRVRTLSVRGFDDQGLMRNADVTDGRDLEAVIDRLFADEQVSYLHVHNAGRGCYAARIDRA